MNRSSHLSTSIADSLVMAVRGAVAQNALQAAGVLEQEGIDAEIADARTLTPSDLQTIFNSDKETRLLVVVDEGFHTCGNDKDVAPRVSRGLGWA
jgi:pyruvate/2-oxoglutarate/acetoin dehydrogenase E1 component